MSFYTEVIQQNPQFHSTTAVRDMELLEPATRAAVQAIIDGAAAQGVTLEVTETYRSQERQQQLFAQHATQLETVGVHHYGLAADFCKVVDGKAAWDGDWSFLTPLCAANGMIWGGDWGQPDKPHSFRDYDHVQRCEVSEQAALFAGTWYPQAAASPATDA
ncbi:MAG: M15 family metallopeptidase [Bryobacteraceae bacterium]